LKVDVELCVIFGRSGCTTEKTQHGIESG